MSQNTAALTIAQIKEIAQSIYCRDHQDDPHGYDIALARAVEKHLRASTAAEQKWPAEEIAAACVKAGLGILECNGLLVTLKANPTAAENTKGPADGDT